MANRRMTANGRTTVPKEIRDRLKLKAGDRLTWSVDNGKIVVRAQNRSIMELAGMLHRSDQRPVTIEELDEAIAQAATESGMAGCNPNGR